MTLTEELTDPQLLRILWACLTYWSTEPSSVDQRSVCYAWVVKVYANKFGGTFHPSRLQYLARLGLLSKDDTSRGGDRRYYRINAPAHLAEFLKGCNLN